VIIIYAINTYKDLCIEIDISKMAIERLNKEKKVWENSLKAPGELQAQTYSDMPHGSVNFTTLDRVIPELNKIDIKLEREELILKGMLEQKELMNCKLKSLTGLEYNVIKYKEIDKFNTIQISQRVNASESTVKRIIARVKKNKKQLIKS
jgi:DNA-directed RNA polymerase specialized sigma24 family protein